MTEQQARLVYLKLLPNQIAAQLVQERREHEAVGETCRALCRLATGLGGALAWVLRPVALLTARGLVALLDVMAGAALGVGVVLWTPAYVAWWLLRGAWRLSYAIGRVVIEGGDHATGAAMLPVLGP